MRYKIDENHRPEELLLKCVMEKKPWKQYVCLNDYHGKEGIITA